MRFETFGIVGYGHFGQFLAASLARVGTVLVCDADDGRLQHTTDGVRSAPLEDVAAADVVILAVPFAAHAGVLHELRDLVGRDTVVMDVVSTKERAGKLLEEILPPDTNLLATHPLFGPPS
ncbi:MAG TPA: prephenate dehydrogenase/arogenate dehydrogenase family protein, partial [Acidimicrobiia bacterium]